MRVIRFSTQPHLTGAKQPWWRGCDGSGGAGGGALRASRCGDLRELALARLGNTDTVVTGTNYFRENLTAAFVGSAPLISLEGMVTHQESGRRGSGVLVYGVDERFWRFHGRDPAQRALTDRQAWLSEALARELASKEGDGILVRMENPSAIPAESLHGKRDQLGRTVRFSTRGALGAPELGEFSLRPTQRAGGVRPLGRLQKRWASGEGQYAAAGERRGARPRFGKAGWGRGSGCESEGGGPVAGSR
jgi:hypothetical protein